MPQRDGFATNCKSCPYSLRVFGINLSTFQLINDTKLKRGNINNSIFRRLKLAGNPRAGLHPVPSAKT